MGMCMKQKINKKVIFIGIGIAILMRWVLTPGMIIQWVQEQFKGDGTLEIITEPGGAQIFINGKPEGTSTLKGEKPFSIKLKHGTYTIEALLPVSRDEEQYGIDADIPVWADDTNTVTIVLEPRETAAVKNDRSALEQKQRADEEAFGRKQFGRFLTLHPGGCIEPTMIDIPSGRFRMGCGAADKDGNSGERPAHWVTLKAYKISATEVTFYEWDAFSAETGAKRPSDEGWGRGMRPVINVSWNDAQGYIAWLNKMTGKHYRLPTEAQWEYAARAGTTTAYFFGNDKKKLAGYGWYNDNSKGKTHVVGSLKPNAWGLYDMAGNVMEWCGDWMEKYPIGPVTNPVGPRTGTYRVLRGGGMDTWDHECRSADRMSYDPDRTYIVDPFFETTKRFGFRLVLLPG